MFDECPECAPKDRVILQVRPADGRVACPHRLYSAETLFRKAASAMTATEAAAGHNRDRCRCPDCFERLRRDRDDLATSVNALTAENSALTKECTARAEESDRYRANIDRLRDADRAQADLCGAATAYLKRQIRELQAHTCKPPLGNPTREEAIEALRSVVRRIDAFAAMQVSDVTLREVGATLDTVRGIAEAALPKTNGHPQSLCQCRHANHQPKGCQNATSMHHLCGPCQSGD